MPGRPLRAAGGRVPSAAVAHAADGGAPDELDHVLGDAWARDAQHEYASIPAFIQLAYELTALGAPRQLVQSAIAAVRDEAQHAAGCAALASSYLRHSVSPTLPKYTPRPMLTCREGLVRLAVESLLDGGVVEGTAARHAARAAEVATPGPAQRLLRRIAADEQRHAELGWDIVAWAMREAPDEVRAALSGISSWLPSAPSDEVAAPDLERFGRLSACELDQIAQRHAAESSKRLTNWLSS